MPETKKRVRTGKAKKSDAPKTPAERDELLAFITQELLAPNNTTVDIDFKNPDALDDELNAIIDEKKIKRDRVGRPTKMTRPTLQKLKLAFLIDCTDIEASHYAGIAPRTLYHFQEKNPEFLHLKQKWRETYIMAARLNVMKSAMNQNVQDSWRILQAKRRGEYGEKEPPKIEDDVVTVEDLEKIANGDYELIEDK